MLVGIYFGQAAALVVLALATAPAVQAQQVARVTTAEQPAPRMAPIQCP